MLRSCSSLIGSSMRTTLLTSQGGVVHLFVFYSYQGAEEDAGKLQLTDRLLQAVLVEAQVVCVGQPVLIAGDLNDDPAVIPCLAKGISAGRFVDLALACSLGEGKRPGATCRFRLDDCAGSRRDFIMGCSDALAASTVCKITDLLFLPHFSVFSSFSIDRWSAEVSCPIDSQPLWPACWIDTLIGPPLRYLVLFMMPGMCTGMSSGLYLLMLYLLSGMRFPGLLSVWSRSAEARTFGPVVPLRLAALLLLEEVCYVFVGEVLEAELLVTGDLVVCIGLVKGMRLMFIVLSTL